MPTPILTIVADVLYSPDGDVVDGRLYITNSSSFISPDGYEVPEGTTLAVPVLDGVFSIGLIPNINATPSGTSYFVKYQVSSQWFVETWIVPQIPNPCKLSDVRALRAPIPAAMIPIIQVLPPSDAIPGEALIWTSQGWQTSATVGSFTPFSLITTETNSTATMTVKAGASIIPDALDPGIIDATEVNGIDIRAIGPLVQGQVAIVQPDLSVAFADPLVQGLFPVNTAVGGINPILVAGSDGTLMRNLLTDSSGRLQTAVTGTVTVVQTTGSNLHVNVDNFPSVGSDVTIVGPVDGSGNVKVVLQNLPDPLPVDGTVDVGNFPSSFEVSNFPATQPVSIAGTVDVAFVAPQHVIVDNTPSSDVQIVGPVDGSGYVATVVKNLPSNQNVTVTGTATTQDNADGTPAGVVQPSKAIQIAGWDGSNFNVPKVDTNGNLFVTPSTAFVPGFVPDRQVAASISSTQTVPISTEGASSVVFMIRGVWTGTIVFESSVDGIHWEPVYAFPQVIDGIPLGTAGTQVSGGFAEDCQWVVPVGGYQQFRLRGNSVLTGDADVVIEAGAGVNAVQVMSQSGANFHVTVDNGSELIVAAILPNPAAPTTQVQAMADQFGRQAVLLNSVRQLVGKAALSSSATILATFIPAAGAGVYTDITTFVVTNTTSLATVVSLSDGTVLHEFALAADGGIVINFPTPLSATSTNIPWKISNTAGALLKYNAIYVRNM